MFIQHFAQEAHNQAKIERKPRRNIQYKDMGTFTPSLLPPPQSILTLTQQTRSSPATTWNS